MEKFKYEVYDYSKAGIKKKLYFQQVLTALEYEALGNVFRYQGKELIETFVAHLKNSYTTEKSRFDGKDYKIDDFIWEWKIITPEGTYKSDETSSKKE